MSEIKWKVSDEVKKIIDEMTLEEKISVLHGANGDPNCANQAGYIAGIDRLEIPELFLVDGESGVNTSWDATLLPAKIGLGATFDVDTAKEYGEILGEEVKDCGVHMLLAPRIMLIRDCIAQFNTSNGGIYQAYSEDPVLIGKLCAAEIEGIQKDGNAIATAKQYVASSTGTAQGAGNSIVDKQTLMEMYVRPFEDAVNAGVGAIMTSYNQVNSIWTYKHPMLHGDILRNRMHFEGPAMNDWFCMYETETICNGVTMEMPGGDMYGEGHEKSFYGKKLIEAIEDENNPVTMEDLDRAVGYYITMLSKFNMIGKKRKPHALSEKQKQRSSKYARKIAAKTGVLLKNDGILPLKKEECENVLMVGPTAENICCPVFKEGAYGFKDRKIGPLKALEDECGHSINFACGDDLEGEVIPNEFLKTGLNSKVNGVKRSVIKLDDKLEKRIEIYDLPKKEYEFEQTDDTVCFTGTNGLPCLNKDGEQGLYYYMWEGVIEAPEDGWYRVSLQTSVPTEEDFEKEIKSNKDMDVGLSGTLNIMKDNTDYYERIASGPRLAYNGGAAPITGGIPCRDGFNNIGEYVYMKKGNKYPFFVTVTSLYYKNVEARLNWVTPSMVKENLEEVATKCKKADKVIVFVWHSCPSLEIELNSHQKQMLDTVCDNNKNVIVVVNSGGPVAMPWENKVNAILEMWYPGQEGARATIDLLLGKYNPSGKLPVTFPKKLEDMPTHDCRFPERYAESGKNPGAFEKQKKVAEFSEKLAVGYRWFEQENIEPQFEFGFGLSYTQFEISNLKIAQDNDGMKISVDVENVGDVKGTEVVQCYITPPKEIPENVSVASKQLIGFACVELEKGQKKNVEIIIDKRELSYFHVEDESNRLSEKEGWRILKGERNILVGTSSRKIELTQSVTVK